MPPHLAMMITASRDFRSRYGKYGGPRWTRTTYLHPVSSRFRLRPSGLTKAERAALLKAPLHIHLGRLHLTFEKAQAADAVDGKYVGQLVPVHVVPGPEGPRMSSVLGELFFALSTLPHQTSYKTRLFDEFGRVGWPEYLSVDIERAWLLTDWLVGTMAPRGSVGTGATRWRRCSKPARRGW